MATGLSLHKPAGFPDALWHSVHAPCTPDQPGGSTVFSGGGGGGGVGASPAAPGQSCCALCGVAAAASPLHLGVGSFAYCTGCLLRVGAAYANGSTQAEATLASFAAPRPSSQPADATSRTCTTCLASKAISNFLRQDGGAVRLERDCNACAAGARQHAQQQQQQQQLQQGFGGWPPAAPAPQPDLSSGLGHNKPGAAWLAQLSSVLQGHMQAQREQQQHQQVGQWQPPPLPLACSAPMHVLAQHLAPRSPLIPEPQRPTPQAPPHPAPLHALPQRPPLPPPRPKSASLSLSRVRSRAESTESDEDYTPSPRTGGGQRGRQPSTLGPRAAGPMKVTAQGKTHKTCSRCRLDKPASCYNLDRGKPDGLYCHCRACCAEMNAVRNQKKVLVTTPTVEAKTCTHCRQHKLACDFYRQNTSHDGLRSWCKTCYSSASAAKSKSAQKRAKRESS